MLDVSEEKKEVQPIIVKKGKANHGGHHGGAWKVAYADFVTAMMAFFLVMWLVSQSNAVKVNVGGYFRDPVGFSKTAKAGILKTEGGAKPVIGSDMALLRKKLEEAVRSSLTRTGDKIRETLDRDQSLELLKGQVEIAMPDEGLRITLIESSRIHFFKRGSDKLEPQAERLLRVIGRQLSILPNHIIIEGHTDAVRYADSASYTNWELSVDRANSARRVMLSGGLKQIQISEVRGFADRQLRFKLKPTDPRNRRVTITVQNDFEIYRYSDTLFVDNSGRN